MERIRHFYLSILALFGVSTVAEVHESIEAQELACAVPIPAEPIAQECHDKHSPQQDLPEEPKVSAGPQLAANAIRQIMATPAQFPAAYYEQTFIKPQRGNLLIISAG